MNSLISFIVSNKLNKIISRLGKILINGVFNVSKIIIKATNDIIKTISFARAGS